MITTADLKSHTKADLAEMAKRLGISVLGSMRKEDLVVAVAKASKPAKSPRVSKVASKTPKVASKQRSNGRASSKISASSAAARGSRAKVGQALSPIKAATQSKSSSAKKTAAKKTSSKAPPNKATATKASSGKLVKSRTTARKSANGKLTNGKTPVNGNASANNGSRSAPSKIAPAKPQTKPATKSVTRTTTDNLKSVGAIAKAPATKAAPAKLLASKSRPLPTPTDPKVLKRIRELQMQRQSDKDLAFRPTLIRPPGAIEPISESEPRKDRVALFVRDAHWMHATWDITRQAIERAKSAMLEQWHGAKPILRLIRMDDTGTTNTSETTERDIEIHGGLRNWYIEWSGEAASFRVLIGYLSSSGRFHVIAKSNIVKTPGAGSPDAVDEHWSDLGAESERLYAVSGGYDGELETGELKEMLEDRLRRTLGAPPLAKLGAGADSPFRNRGGFHFDMEVELVVYGSTVSDGYLTLNGEPVALRSDGTFALRVPFPDRRQVLPAVACSRDGSQQRTIVVAVERNTKIMEPLESEQDTGE